MALHALRWKTDAQRTDDEKLILTLECVLTQYGMRHPELARIGVADIALTHGGPFYGKKYGGLGHGSHQNGLDADVLMPRKDLCECAPQSPSEVDADCNAKTPKRDAT